MLPKEFPTFTTFQDYPHMLCNSGMLELIHTTLHIVRSQKCQAEL